MTAKQMKNLRASGGGPAFFKPIGKGARGTNIKVVRTGRAASVAIRARVRKQLRCSGQIRVCRLNDVYLHRMRRRHTIRLSLLPRSRKQMNLGQLEALKIISALPNDVWLTTEEAAVVLRCHPSTLERMRQPNSTPQGPPI